MDTAVGGTAWVGRQPPTDPYAQRRRPQMLLAPADDRPRPSRSIASRGSPAARARASPHRRAGPRPPPRPASLLEHRLSGARILFVGDDLLPPGRALAPCSKTSPCLRYRPHAPLVTQSRLARRRRRPRRHRCRRHPRRVGTGDSGSQLARSPPSPRHAPRAQRHGSRQRSA